MANMGTATILVSELIEALEGFNPDAVVVLSRDEEGNGYDTLYSLEEMMYDPRHRQIGYAKITPEMRKMGYTEEDTLPDGVPAVVLWP